MQAAEHCEVMSVAVLDSCGHVPVWVGSLLLPLAVLNPPTSLEPTTYLEPLKGQKHKAHILAARCGSS